MKHRLEVMYLSSCGGHLVQLLKISAAIRSESCVFVVNDRTDLDKQMVGKTIVITHATRNLKQFINLYEAIVLIAKYRPKVLISTGAAPAVPFSIIGKLFGTKIIFVESFSRVVAPSLTGRLMYHIADDFYIQWPKLLEVFPRAKFFGSLLK